MVPWFLLALACTADDAASDDSTTKDGMDSAGDSPADTTPGTLSLSFRMDADYIPSMEEPPVGTFRGSIYAEADASSVGPVDGASPLLDFSVAGVDLSSDGGPTAALYTSDPLAPQIVWILGCLDSDDNDCDKSDPITVPNENKVIVAAGTDTPFTVFMGLLNPS